MLQVIESPESTNNNDNKFSCPKTRGTVYIIYQSGEDISDFIVVVLYLL